MTTLPTSFTEDELKGFLLDTAAMEKQDLADNTFKPKFIWYDAETRAPRLALFPSLNDEHDLRNAKLEFAVSVLSTCMDANRLIWITDTCMATQMTKHDGTRWGPGEMQQALENKTMDADLVTEALHFTVVMKEGWGAFASLKYTRTDDGIEYDPDPVIMIEDVDQPNQHMGGFFPEMMRSAMAHPKMVETMHEQGVGEALGLSKTRADMHMICAGVKHVMAQVHWPCMIATMNDEERSVMMTSLDGHDGVKAFDEEQLEEIQNLEASWEVGE